VLVWAEHDGKPWQTEAFRFSIDPDLEARVRDVVGLYLEPSAHAIVLCLERRTRDRAANMRAMAPVVVPLNRWTLGRAWPRVGSSPKFH
jgi:hypothetical protein